MTSFSNLELLPPNKRQCQRNVDNNNNNNSNNNNNKKSKYQNDLNIPTLHPNDGGKIDAQTFLDKFTKYQLLYLPKILHNPNNNPTNNANDSDSRNNHGQYDNSPLQDESNEERQSTTTTWRNISNIFQSLNEKDKASFTIENYSERDDDDVNDDDVDHVDDHNQKSKSGNLFLKEGDEINDNNNTYVNKAKKGYCSFIVQHDKLVLRDTLKSLPLSDLSTVIEFHQQSHTPQNDDNKEKHCPTSSPSNNKDRPYSNDNDKNDNKSYNITYGPGLWFFYGRNDCKKGDVEKGSHAPLNGRPEHTDSVSHDGTWHYQLSGRKTWYLRPTQELIQKNIKSVNDDDDNDDDDESTLLRKRIQVDCFEGDVLLVNTRLWWHRTEIPVQPMAEEEYTKRNNGDMDRETIRKTTRALPSVSYARDIYFKNSVKQRKDIQLCGETDPEEGEETEGENMTNIDGLYAANDIDSGTIIFTEKDMPDCELHRSKDNPNCEIISLEDGTGAIVSSRCIKSGEFFCVPQSTDEESSDDDYEALDDEIITDM